MRTVNFRKERFRILYAKSANITRTSFAIKVERFRRKKNFISTFFIKGLNIQNKTPVQRSVKKISKFPLKRYKVRTFLHGA